MKKGMTTLLVFVFMMSDFAFSQNPWTDHESRTTIAVEWTSPQFGKNWDGLFVRNNVATNMMNTVGYLNARIRLHEYVYVLAELPVSHFEWRSNSSEFRTFNKATERGNPFIGTELRTPADPGTWQKFFNLGTYLPRKQKTWQIDETLDCECVISEYHGAAQNAIIHNRKPGSHPALLSDFIRGEAYWEDVWSVRANAGAARDFIEDKGKAGFSMGIIHNIYRGDLAELYNRETYIAYSAYLMSDFDIVTIQTTFYGRSPMGVKGQTFTDDSLLQLRSGIGREIGPVYLGGFVSRPLTRKHLEILKWSFGVNLAVNL
jgi:hypothetical protein